MRQVLASIAGIGPRATRYRVPSSVFANPCPITETATGPAAPNPRPGELYTYELDDNVWTLVRIDAQPGGIPFSSYGESIALSGDNAIVGADLFDGAFEDSGEAYDYDLSSLVTHVDSISLSAGGPRTSS